MTTVVETLSRVLRAFDRIPWWGIHVGLILATVAAMGAIFGSIAIQSAIQGIVVGSIYVLGASGLSLTYGIKKFANFAHGDLMTVGAYTAYATSVLWGGDILLGVVLAILTVAFLAMFLELSIFRRLEGRGPVPALIASVGVSLVLQNVIGAIFLGEIRYFNVGIPRDFSIGNTGLSFNWLKGGATLVISTALIVFLHVLLKYTTLGKAMRACSDDLDLARTSGINTRNVILLFIFAAVIVGGIGSPYGAMLGGLIIGLVQKLSSVLFEAARGANILEGGSSYEPAGAFIVMILVLLLKPEGIMGTSRERLGGGIRGLRVRRRREAGHGGP
jgi:branched-chain amino acid transport system permease protein/neutral amino acid transport system permease protein